MLSSAVVATAVATTSIAAEFLCPNCTILRITRTAESMVCQHQQVFVKIAKSEENLYNNGHTDTKSRYYLATYFYGDYCNISVTASSNRMQLHKMLTHEMRRRRNAIATKIKENRKYAFLATAPDYSEWQSLSSLNIVVLVLVLLAIVSIAFFLYQDRQNIGNYPRRKSSVPLIVAWTSFFTGSLKESLLPTLDGCEYQCELIDRGELKIYSNNVSAYILHAPNIEVSDLPPRNTQQLFVMFVLESPYHTGSQLQRVPRNYFNATISYRQGSRYYYPYGHFVPLTADDKRSSSAMTENELLSSAEKKTRGSLIFVSNCNTPSKREEVIRELGVYTEITVRGLCERELLAYDQLGSSSCKANCSDDDLIATHRFYISLENSICDEYITEKFFWRASQMLVPVVMKRKIYEGSNIPNDSFIAIDDFDNLKELGNYLNYLRINDTEYLKYFNWTKHFRKPNAYKSDAVCRLCQDIYTGENLTMDNVEKYYDKRECQYSKSSNVNASKYWIISAFLIASLSYDIPSILS